MILTHDCTKTDGETETYGAPFTEVVGNVSYSRFAPGQSLWMLAATLPEGSELRWAPQHGDEAIFVKRNSVVIDGTEHPAGTVLIIEADAQPSLGAAGPVELLHFGPTSPLPPEDGPIGPADRAKPTTHVIEPGQEYVRTRIPDAPVTASVYADSNCPSCRINFFMAVGNRAHGGNGSHTHSQDEVLHVLEGELQFGRLTLGPGMSAFIPGSFRYGYRASGPYRFLNYRRDMSMLVTTPGSEPVMES